MQKTYVLDMTDTYDSQTPLNQDFPPTLLSSGFQAFSMNFLSWASVNMSCHILQIF